MNIEYNESNLGEACNCRILSTRRDIGFHINRLFTTVAGITLKQYFWEESSVFVLAEGGLLYFESAKDPFTLVDPLWNA
jgi:hypothetical protein